MDVNQSFGKNLRKRTIGKKMKNIFWNKFEIYSKIAKRFSVCPKCSGNKAGTKMDSWN